jgi:Peptidase M15
LLVLRNARVLRFVSIFVLGFAFTQPLAARPVVVIEPAAMQLNLPPIAPQTLIKKVAIRKETRTGMGGLNSRLVSVLRQVERRYGRPVTISSGCRSHARNRAAGGAKRSLHLQCKAADIRVAGISEGQLLRYVRALPGVGGVGTYCGNSVVHVDIGPRRAWTGGCGRRKRR